VSHPRRQFPDSLQLLSLMQLLFQIFALGDVTGDDDAAGQLSL
jgi:hypothetical protein